jgi:hypothetical protein
MLIVSFSFHYNPLLPPSSRFSFSALPPIWLSSFHSLTSSLPTYLSSLLPLLPPSLRLLQYPELRSRSEMDKIHVLNIIKYMIKGHWFDISQCCIKYAPPKMLSTLLPSNSQSQSHFTTDSQSVCLSVCLGVEPRLGLMTRYLFWMKVTVLSIWGALSDERSGLSFVSHSR